MGKNSLNNFICHLSWLEKLSPTHTHPLISIREFFKTLWVIIFWVRVTHKKLSVNSSTWITHPPTPSWPTPPHPCMTHPTPAWHTPPPCMTPHPYMTQPTPPLHDPPHPCMTHPTPLHDTPHPTLPLHDPPHPTSAWHTPPHPTPAWPTPPCPYMTHPTPPHPWYIFGHKGAFFHGLLHYVSLSVDNKVMWFPDMPTCLKECLEKTCSIVIHDRVLQSTFN